MVLFEAVAAVLVVAAVWAVAADRVVSFPCLTRKLWIKLLPRLCILPRFSRVVL